LRTPLNAIIGFSQLLQRDIEHPLTEDQLDSLSEILHGARHLLAIVNEDLDISRIESGQMKFNLSTVNSSDWLIQCLQLTAALTSGLEVTVVSAVDDTLPNIDVDARHATQSLINLLSTAIKYNKAGGTLTFETDQAGSELIRVKVIDTGVGLPDGDQERVFKKFDRLSFTNSKVEGSGIGLALTKDIVEGMGGLIGFKSKQGVGSYI